MPPNVTVPLLVFNILVREFNPQPTTYIVLSCNHSAANIVEQILDFTDVEIIESVGSLNFITSPNCILLLSSDEWTRPSDAFEKSIAKCTTLLAPGIDQIPEVIIKLMRYRFRNVIAYTVNDSSIIHLVLPYHSPHRYGSDEIPISSWGASNYSKLSRFLEKSRMNVNRAEYIAALFPKRYTAVMENDGSFSGFDGEMLKLITTSINATLKIYIADRSIKYGSKLENGSFNGILGDVYSWRADIACNSIFIKEYGSSDFVFSPALQLEHLCIVVPPPLLVPNWKMVFRAFELEVWLCTCFTVVISMILWYLLNLLARTKPDFAESVLFIGRIFISTVKLPKATWQRIFTYSLILSACVLSPSFEGSLLKLLKKRSYEREIKTMKEFKDSEYNIYTFSSNLLMDSTPDYLEGRVRLFSAVDGGIDLLGMVASYRNLSYLGKRCDILQRVSSEGWQVYVLNDYPRIYLTSYVMRRGNLLIRAINTAVLRIVASGIMQSPRLNSECNEPVKESDYLRPKALALSNLMIAFYTLEMGFIAAFIAFLGEHAASYFKTNWSTWSRKRRLVKVASHRSNIFTNK